jgi:hypothetical protein
MIRVFILADPVSMISILSEIFAFCDFLIIFLFFLSGYSNLHKSISKFEEYKDISKESSKKLTAKTFPLRN